jgi:MarR family 2-MHQ and catechol resistance regulon transcriptional repressor
MAAKDLPAVPKSADVWLVIRKAAHWIQQHGIRSVETTGLGLTDFAVLKALFYTGPLPVNVIGAKVLLTSGSITSAVDRLESQGLVERQAHPSDRRASLVALTADGEALIKPASRAHARTMAEVVSVLSEAEQRELVRLMKKIGKHAMATYRQADVIPLRTAPQKNGGAAGRVTAKNGTVPPR